MMSSLFTPIASAVGGVLIGLAVGVLYLGIGRVAGISGMLNDIIDDGRERGWRIAFVLALLAGAALWLWSMPDAKLQPIDGRGWLLVVSGLLVGAGTRWANGCTSGHGICGLARFSKRSLVAVAVFMGTAMLTVYLIRHAGGWA